MPVLDERATVAEAIDRVLDLDLGETSIELVVVESNSTDGSRDIVLKHIGDERVKVVLQDAARGKGNAVREGLRHLTGQVVLIQDADLEYTADDYPALLAPIIEGRADFVLGSRHSRQRPIRVMGGSRLSSAALNAGHWLLNGLFNLTYGVRLRDPFTMYKVFRAECIDGVPFESNRFDFDWELVGKLIRLGYLPLEVPVSYEARSFAEGKKVRVLRDPPTWIVACFRYRFSRLARAPRLVRPTSTAACLGSNEASSSR
jgi:glycosyltransferase involved in cell wall biosynthesis